jgi:two-component system, chemotaxis family, chemotaxis protein CheY
MTTILVVDDYVSNHRLMDFVLRRNGYQVLVATNGLQALDQLTRASVDLVLTDLAMPKMDGLALLEHLRADVRYAHLPVVIVTASVNDRDARRARKAGVTDFLTKPVESEQLVRIVQQLTAATAA